MKNVKKIVGLLVILAMAICMTIPAYAANEGAIEIANPQADTEYKAYKIFDVIYDADKDNYAYTIADDSAWLATVQAYAANTANGLTVTDVTTDDLYTVRFNEAFHAADFAKALKAAGITADAIAFADSKAENLELGYYFVTTSTGALCSLTTTDPTVTIHDKNEKPTISKTASDTNVEVGQTITYTIKGKVPSTTGYKVYKYIVSDTLGTGLTFNQNSIYVTVGGEEMDFENAVTYTENGFIINGELATAVNSGLFDIGDEIVITYTATVNEDAFNVEEITNNATLKYSNDPSNVDGTTTETTTADEKVYIANVVIDKYAVNALNAEDKATKLDGAQFKLYRLGENDAKEYYHWNADDKKVEWVTDAADADVVETKNGAATFYGIQPDATVKYYLEEIKAPEGYNRLNNPVAVTIAAAFDATSNEFTGITGNEVSVGNQAGVLLPSTGGIGTTIFYVVGIALIAGAFILIVSKKRMSTEK